MISRYAWYLREFLKKVWVRVVGFAIFAVLVAVLARHLSPYLPQELALQTGSEAVSQLLGILTSSMLAVTTFSLSIAVSAFAAAAEAATPRATVLLQQDRTTQNVLATFLGVFLFGLVGLVALQAEFYDATGKVVVFLFTIVVIGLVIVALNRLYRSSQAQREQKDLKGYLLSKKKDKNKIHYLLQGLFSSLCHLFTVGIGANKASCHTD